MSTDLKEASSHEGSTELEKIRLQSEESSFIIQKCAFITFSLPSKFRFYIRDKAMFCSIIRYICIGETASGYAALKYLPPQKAYTGYSVVHITVDSI